MALICRKLARPRLLTKWSKLRWNGFTRGLPISRMGGKLCRRSSDWLWPIAFSGPTSYRIVGRKIIALVESLHLMPQTLKIFAHYTHGICTHWESLSGVSASEYRPESLRF
jgi:hypothetical protein